VPLLLRSPDAALDHAQSGALVDVSVSLLEVLAALSPAAWLINTGSYVRLGRYDARPSAVHRVGRLAIQQYELVVPVTVNRGDFESCDRAWLARILLEATAHRLDTVMLSAKPDPRGLLHDIGPAVENVAADDVMGRDLDRLRDKLGPRAAVIIVPAAQAVALDRAGTKSAAYQVRRSSGMPERTVILAAQDAVVSGIGEMRISAKAGLGSLELRLHLPLAWGAKPDAITWMRAVKWGVDEVPEPALEPPPWGLGETEICELAREFAITLLRTDRGEADKRLVAHLKHFGCPRDQLAAWTEHVKALPLGTL
jgi:hypothetical protein